MSCCPRRRPRRRGLKTGGYRQCFRSENFQKSHPPAHPEQKEKWPETQTRLTHEEPLARRPGSRGLWIDGRARSQHDDQFSRHQLAGQVFKPIPILTAWSEHHIPQPSGLSPTRLPPRLQVPGHPHPCGTGHQPWAPTSNSAGRSFPRLGHRPFLTSTGLFVRLVD